MLLFSSAAFRNYAVYASLLYIIVVANAVVYDGDDGDGVMTVRLVNAVGASG
jgi:hypothetical protein